MVYPPHLLSLGQRQDIFHSPGTCSFSSQGLFVEGEKVPTRWMRFKLGRKCRGKRRQRRENNDERLICCSVTLVQAVMRPEPAATCCKDG